MKRKSTSIQLFVQSKLLQDAFEKSEETYTLHLDFSKAFDRVCHRTFLKKLRTFGIGGNLLKLLSSFLQSRRQRVIVAAEVGNITSGVPEGLFTKIKTKCPSELPNDLLRPYDWAFENKLVFNADKTKLIWFSLKKPDEK